MPVLVLFLMGTAGRFFAQAPEMVRLQDLNDDQVVLEALTGGAGQAGGATLFRGTDSEHGQEVWIVSGNTASLAADVRPGPESSFPDGFAALGSNYFTCVADDGVTGPEVRVFSISGGLVTSFWAATDLRSGADHAAPVLLGCGGGIVWYSMEDVDGSGRPSQSVWAFAASAMPQRVGSYQIGSVQQATVVPGTSRLCFIARPHSNADLRLFTVSAAQMAVECGAMGPPAQAEPLPVPVYAATSGFVCFRTMSGGPQMHVRTFATGQNAMLQALGESVTPWPASNGVDRVCFAGYEAATGVELWVTEGTPGTTTRLTDLAVGGASSLPSRIQMVPGSNRGVFFQTGAEGGARSLYFASRLFDSPTFQLVSNQTHLAADFTLVSQQEIAFTRASGADRLVMLGNGATGVQTQLDTGTAVHRLWHPGTAALQRELNWLIETSQVFRVKTLALTGNSSSVVAEFDKPPSGAGQLPQIFQSSPSSQVFVIGSDHLQPRLLQKFDGFGDASAQNIPLQPGIIYLPANASSHPADFFEIDGQLVLSALTNGRRVLFFSHTGEPGSLQTVESLNGPPATPGAYDVGQVVKLGARLFLTGLSPRQATGARRLFSARYAPESSYGGVVVDLVEETGQPLEVEALAVAAGKVFVVSPGTTTQTLRCIDASLNLTTVGVFTKDSQGGGIADLTGTPGQLFFSALATSGLAAGQRTVWSSMGLAGDAVSSPFPILAPRLLGTWDGQIVAWSLVNAGSSFSVFRWSGAASVVPETVFQATVSQQPLHSREWNCPSGIEGNGHFYFSNRIGQVVSLSSTGGAEAHSGDPYQTLPEHLATLGGMLHYHWLRRNEDRWSLFRWDDISSQPLLDNTLHARSGPLLPHGGRLWFSRLASGNPPDKTELWSTDGTWIPDQQAVLRLSNHRATTLKSAGTYRGHLLFGGEVDTSLGGIEPCILNMPPRAAAIPLVTGAVREQPFTFTYSQIVTGVATDADGDPVSAPAIRPGASGLLKRNSSVITAETPILPGDIFEWTPPSEPVGNLEAARLVFTDPWSEGATPVLIRVDTPLDEWTRLRFTPAELADPAISGIEADPDGDGVSNGLEFLFARDPRVHEPEAGTWFSGGMLPSGEKHMVFSFKRMASLPAGTLLELDQSDDLLSWWTAAEKNAAAPWNPLSGTVTVDELTLPDGRVQTSITMDEFQSEPRFLRLRMTVP